MSNILVVESGSTKTDWILVTPSESKHYHSVGINPASDSVMPDLMEICPELTIKLDEVSKVYYYGAGVIDRETRSLVRTMIAKYSPTADFTIESDLLGACVATCHSSSGIVSILGTGSNSCLYENGTLTQINPALGYIMSNEGGGTTIGKSIVKQFFYNQMPTKVKSEFESNYPIERVGFITRLYRAPNPTAFLANFAPFINTVSDLEWRKSLLTSIFQEFIDIRIKCFEDYDKYPLHFVGSIAYFCREELRETLQHNGLEATTILQRPIERLVTIHK